MLAPPGLAAAAPAARVTASVGSASSGADALEMREGLEDGADLETGDDGGCSLLVDQDALMEVCGGTSLKLDRKDGKPDGPRIVKLDRGEIRMVVEPRVGEERIEIHTPAAIATILGTILHVSVDALGVTTITSAASKVLVQSSDLSVSGSTTIDGGEQVVIRPGEPPAKQGAKVTPQAMSALGGCLIDFHAASLAQDRGDAEAAQVEEAVGQDVAEAALPGVAEGGPDQILEGQINNLQNNVANPVDDPPNNVVDNLAQAGDIPDIGDILEPVPPGGPCPPGLPGEGCGF